MAIGHPQASEHSKKCKEEIKVKEEIGGLIYAQFHE